MFLEFYKKFKEELGESELFENTSFGNNKLFGFEKYLDEKYDNYIEQSDIVEFNKSLEESISKLNFVKGFLEYYKQTLQDESSVLDAEIEMINNTASAKGSSFLELKDRMLDFDKVLTVSLSHMKNMKTVGDTNYKVEEESVKCEGYLSYPKYDSIIFNMKEALNVNEIIFESHKESTLSIYGERKDGTTVPLFLNANSSQRLFVNTFDGEYNKIIFISNSDIKSYIKSISVYSKDSSSSNSLKNGFIFSSTKSNNCKNIMISSDSSSEMFMLTKNEFELAIKEIHDNEQNVIDKYLTEKNHVNKNSTLSFDIIVPEFYFVEKIDKNINSTKEIKIFGKE
ncbi:MAG: hypothetical protein ACRC92_00555 [Peptostreptococcaceae bacterium]